MRKLRFDRLNPFASIDSVYQWSVGIIVFAFFTHHLYDIVHRPPHVIFTAEHWGYSTLPSSPSLWWLLSIAYLTALIGLFAVKNYSYRAVLAGLCFVLHVTFLKGNPNFYWGAGVMAPWVFLIICVGEFTRKRELIPLAFQYLAASIYTIVILNRLPSIHWGYSILEGTLTNPAWSHLTALPVETFRIALIPLGYCVFIIELMFPILVVFRKKSILPLWTCLLIALHFLALFALFIYTWQLLMIGLLLGGVAWKQNSINQKSSRGMMAFFVMLVLIGIPSKFLSTSINDIQKELQNSLDVVGLSGPKYMSMFPDPREEHYKTSCLLLIESDGIQWKILNHNASLKHCTRQSHLMSDPFLNRFYTRATVRGVFSEKPNNPKLRKILCSEYPTATYLTYFVLREGYYITTNKAFSRFNILNSVSCDLSKELHVPNITQQEMTDRIHSRLE